MEGGREGSLELASAERESDGHDRECTASSVEEKTLDMMLVTVKQCQRGLSISPTSRPQTCIKFNSFPSFLPLSSYIYTRRPPHISLTPPSHPPSLPPPLSPPSPALPFPPPRPSSDPHPHPPFVPSPTTRVLSASPKSIFPEDPS